MPGPGAREKNSVTATVTPFIDSIAPVVTTCEIGAMQTCKPQFPVESTLSKTAPTATKTFVAPKILLPGKPQENTSSWATIARKAVKLPDPPVASISRKHTQLTNNTL